MPIDNATIELPAVTVPYLDQWLGYWFIEPRRGEALYSALSRLNVAVHLQSRTGEAESRRQQDPPPEPSPADDVDHMRSPEQRIAYGYRVIDGVAILSLAGTLLKHEASAAESTSTVMMRRSVRRAMRDQQVKAVIFQIDSPGGTVAGAYELAADIRELARVKPVHAHGANVVASAAYLMASQMRSISANPSALIGSLGTFGVVYDMSEMAQREGVRVHLLKGRVRGREALMKGVGTPGTAISDEQLQRLQQEIDDLNEQFIQAVLNGPRQPASEKVEDWFADAGVWIAAKAQTMGLIDRVESFDDLLRRVTAEVNGRSGTTDRPDAVGGASQQTTDAGGTAAGDQQTAEAPGDPVAADASGLDRKELSIMPQQANNASTAPAATESQNPKQTAAAADPVGGSQSADNRPATVAELEAACPGASSDFLLDCARKSMTLSQATDAFIGWQSAQIRARDEQIAQLNTDLQARDKQIAELQAGGGQASASRKPGVPVIEADDKNAAAATAPAVDSDDPAAVAKAEWEANANNCRESFVSEAAYVGYRKAQLRGQIRRDSKRRGK